MTALRCGTKCCTSCSALERPDIHGRNSSESAVERFIAPRTVSTTADQRLPAIQRQSPFPEKISLSRDSGRIAMTVLAANRTGQSAEVAIPSDNIGFGFNLTSDKGIVWEGGVPVPAAETTRFAAGEVKRYVFDFRIAYDFGPFPRAPGLPMGTYIFGGAYGGQPASNPPTVALTP